MSDLSAIITRGFDSKFLVTQGFGFSQIAFNNSKSSYSTSGTSIQDGSAASTNKYIDGSDSPTTPSHDGDEITPSIVLSTEAKDVVTTTDGDVLVTTPLQDGNSLNTTSVGKGTPIATN